MKTAKIFDNYILYEDGRLYCTLRGVFLKQSTWLYKTYNIRINGKRRQMLTHRLLAQAFIPNPENKPQVNHIDGNKLNNDLSNLEWVTCSENGKHAFRVGLIKPHGPSKKVIDKSNNIIYESATHAALALNYSRAHICNMIKGYRTNKFNLKYHKP